MNLAPWIRASYALGWAESEAPVTESAEDQCAWLMSVAVDPGVIEVARSLAAAQGRWTYHNLRRDALFTKFNLLQKPLLAKLAKKAAGKIARIHGKRELAANLLNESDQGDVLRVLQDSIDPAEWQSLLQEAWLNAKAEGNTEAMAMISAATNAPMLSMDVEFPQFLDALRARELISGRAVTVATDEWIQKQLDGMAYFISQDVATAIESGATYEQLLEVVSGDIEDGLASGLILDNMISTGVNQGSLDQYASEGVDLVDILISPDACDDCAELEASNPMSLDEADGEVPVHFNCRCAIAPHIE